MGGVRPRIFSSSKRWNPKAAANLPAKKIGDFVVSGHRLPSTGRWIPIDRVRGAFALQLAAVLVQVAQQLAPFHANSSRVASSLRRLLASSRRSSISSRMAWRRLSRHSSSVRPCPLASGTSGQKATYQSPSRWISALIGKFMLSIVAPFALFASSRNGHAFDVLPLLFPKNQHSCVSTQPCVIRVYLLLSVAMPFRLSQPSLALRARRSRMGGVKPRIFFASRRMRLREGQSMRLSKPAAARYVEGSGMAVMVK